MKANTLWFMAVILACLAVVRTEDDKLGLASLSVGRFTTSMLAEIGREVGNDNIVINPVTIWSVLAMVFPASAGATKTELADMMNIDAANAEQVDPTYLAIARIVNEKSSQVESKIVNMLAKTPDIKLHDDFLSRAANVYHAKEFAVVDKNEATRNINGWAADVTQQRILEIVQSENFDNMTILLGSAGYFKGLWKFPFAENATAEDTFKNEDDMIISSSIPMMRNRGIYNYTYIPDLEAQAIDIPYDDQTSLLVILPRRKVKLQTVLDKMRNKSLNELFPSEGLSPEEVDLSLPKFSTTFQGVLNGPLYYLGVKSLLNPGAKLPKLSDKAFISKITHKAEIETNEKGTEASAATVAHLINKITPISFQANRPFVYFVNHVPTRLVMFAGKYSVPRNT